MSQERPEVRTLNLREVELQVFREIVSGIPWETALRSKGVEQCWQICKEISHRVQHLTLHPQEIGQEGQDTSMAEQGSLCQNKRKEQIHRQLKLRQGTWECYNEEAQFCRDGVRKVKGKAGIEHGKI